VASPSARRPYDLHHAAVSTWLNSGVPSPQVAEWVGHSTEVLLRVYAKGIDGQEAANLVRIDRAMQQPDEP
jgi:integrase